MRNRIEKIKGLETIVVWALVLLVVDFYRPDLNLSKLAMGLLIVGVFVPKLCVIFGDYWFKLGEILSKKIGRCIIGLLYYLPFSFLSLFVKIDRNAKMRTRNKVITLKDLEKPW